MKIAASILPVVLALCSNPRGVAAQSEVAVPHPSDSNIVAYRDHGYQVTVGRIRIEVGNEQVYELVGEAEGDRLGVSGGEWSPVGHVFVARSGEYGTGCPGGTSDCGAMHVISLSDTWRLVATRYGQGSADTFSDTGAEWSDDGNFYAVRSAEYASGCPDGSGPCGAIHVFRNGTFAAVQQDGSCVPYNSTSGASPWAVDVEFNGDVVVWDETSYAPTYGDINGQAPECRPEEDAEQEGDTGDSNGDALAVSEDGDAPHDENEPETTFIVRAKSAFVVERGASVYIGEPTE